MHSLNNQSVLITGGTGSLGTAIIIACKRAGINVRFTTVSRNESKIETLKRRFPDVNVLMGDVRDYQAMLTLVRGHDTVLHCSAQKIVPVAERQSTEALTNNAIGSMNVARACGEARVPRCLLISTDKACGPTMYGASKRLCEGVWREMAGYYMGTSFTCCRYGNVCGSANSVIPFWQQQRAQGKPLTLTCGAMTRFWLGLNEAVDLIDFTLTLNGSGHIVVPKAGASTVAELAQALHPGYPIIETGIRPGERMHEALTVHEELANITDMPGHYCVGPLPIGVGPADVFTSANASRLSATELVQKAEAYGSLS